MSLGFLFPPAIEVHLPFASFRPQTVALTDAIRFTALYQGDGPSGEHQPGDGSECQLWLETLEVR